MTWMGIFFFSLMAMSFAYALIAGGWEGRTTIAIFVAAFILTDMYSSGRGNWTHTNYAVMAVDAGCMIALALVASASKRHWPIWVLGFQMAAVATHGATLSTPDVASRAYYAFTSFWSIAEMAVMVAGIGFDRRHDGRVRKAKPA